MLKIVYPICCGMDVQKSFVVACIASTNAQGVTSYKSKRFSTFTGDLRRCADWLSENNCKDVCMESTGRMCLGRQRPRLQTGFWRIQQRKSRMFLISEPRE